MPSFPEEIERVGRRYMCGIASVPDRLGDFLGRQGITLPGGGAREALRRFACGNSDGTGVIRPAPQPQYPGGQCAARYNVQITYTANFQGVPQGATNDTANNVQGPLGDVTFQIGNPSGLSFFIDTATGPVQFGNRGGSPWTNVVITNVSPVRVGGAPDNCGNRPGGDDDLIGDDEIDTDDGPGGPVIIIPTGVTVNGIGELTFELNVEGPLFEANFEFGFGGGESGPGVPGLGSLAPAIPNDAPGYDPDAPDEPPDPAGQPSNIIGLVVVATSTGRNSQTELGGVGSPTFRVPRIGDVFFAVQVNGKPSWTLDQPIKLGKQFIPVNAPLFAYDWGLREEPNWDIQAFPVTVKDKECGPYYETPQPLLD